MLTTALSDQIYTTSWKTAVGEITSNVENTHE